MHASKIGLRNAIQPPSHEQQTKKLKKACKDFEAVFVYQMLKSMRKTIQKCDLFHGGQGEETYQSLMDMELSKEMADLGPGSLSRLLYDEFKGLLDTKPQGAEANNVTKIEK